MFSFRRKPRQSQENVQTMRSTPSLPQLSAQGVSWPSNLVSIASIRQARRPDYQSSPKGATSLDIPTYGKSVPKGGKNASPGGPPTGAERGPIHSLYVSNAPPSAFDNWRGTSKKVAPSRKVEKKVQRIPTTFNLMVAGGQGSGKTSLLRLLLETAEVSPFATVEQRNALDKFLHGAPKRTTSIHSACVEISESRFDQILFSVVDTPGLDFNDGKELKLERQVNSILRYVDAQYADTMGEESKVVRKSKGDQHVHLCIFMIDPSSVTETPRRQPSDLKKSRSDTTISYRTPDLISDNTSDNDSEDERPTRLVLSPLVIKAIRRISERTNVLPVVARADSLTDDKLAAIKEAVRVGLSEAKLDFGVIGPPGGLKKKSANGNGHAKESDEDDEEEEIEEEERVARPVIKLRPRSSTNGGRDRSNSRSKRDLSEASRDSNRPITPDTFDAESVPNLRFSAHMMAKTDIDSLLPFALVAPETGKRREILGENAAVSTSSLDEDGRATNDVGAAKSRRGSVSNALNPPEDLKGVFVRNFRWGTIDVLNPEHCDFPALRTAVLSTHLKLLKLQTKEVLYEKFRTEKLLVRKANQTISADQREQMLQGL